MAMPQLKVNPRQFPNPTDKAMQSARMILSRWSPEKIQHYEDFYGKPAPAITRMSLQELAKQIDMLWHFGTKHGVHLSEYNVEFPKSDEELEAIAIEKKGFKYTIGDMLPWTTKAVYAGPNITICDYHNVFYIVWGNRVAGIYRDGKEYRVAANSQLNVKWEFPVRFDGLDAATKAVCVLFGATGAKELESVYGFRKVTGCVLFQEDECQAVTESDSKFFAL